jgi:hypothetical protein
MTAPPPALILIDPQALEVAFDVYERTSARRIVALEAAIRAYLAARVRTAGGGGGAGARADGPVGRSGRRMQCRAPCPCQTERRR